MTRLNLAVPRPDRRAQVRAILTGSVPNLVQWFNLYVYATFAPYFRTEFFDPGSPDSLVWVYALFAVTFLVRPLGSWIFGRLADTGGRERALVTAVTLMSAASLVLAATPTERVIGVWAAVILVVVSVVQGVAAGGGYAAAAVLLSESGTRGRRGFFSSFQGATIVGGLVLAQGLLLVLLLAGDRADVAAWGWRVAFAASGLAGLVSLWWARSARRSALTAPKGGASTMAELLRGYWRPLLWVILLTAGGSAAFYTATVTVPYLIRETFFADGGAAAERESTGLVLAAFVILMLMQPLGGALSDRIGRKPLLVVFGVGGVLGAGALVTAAARVTSPAAVFAVLVLAFAVLTCYLSVNGIAKAEVFPAHIRALGVGFGYAVSNSLFGGTAPLMFHATGGGVGFIVYLTVLLAVTAGAAIAMRGGVGTVLDAPPGATAPKP